LKNINLLRCRGSASALFVITLFNQLGTELSRVEGIVLIAHNDE
jgi:hypothetical protein